MAEESTLENSLSSTPEAPEAVVKKKRKQPYGAGSKNRFAKNLRLNRAKHEERTGNSIAETLSKVNTANALEKGGRAAAERLLGAAKEQLAESKKESAQLRRQNEGHQSSLNMAREFASEKDAEAQREKAGRLKAERERRTAEAAKERAEAERRAMAARNAEMAKELRQLKRTEKSLRETSLQICEAVGVTLPSGTAREAEEGSTRSLEEELQLERFRVSRLQRRVDALDPEVKKLKQSVTTEKMKYTTRQKQRAEKYKEMAKNIRAEDAGGEEEEEEDGTLGECVGR